MKLKNHAENGKMKQEICDKRENRLKIEEKIQKKRNHRKKEEKEREVTQGQT